MSEAERDDLQMEETARVADGERQPYVSEDLFLGAGVCRTNPQSSSVPPLLPEMVPAGSVYLNMTQDVPLDLPLSAAPLAMSDSTYVETSEWRTGLSFPHQGPYVFPRARMPPRFALQAPGMAGSGVLSGHGLGLEPGRSLRNVASSVCTSQGINRNGLNRREDIYRLSQNPWGPNTVFGPRSLPTDMPSWQIRDGEFSYGQERHVHSDGNRNLLRGEEHWLGMYSKYRGCPGVIRRVRDKIADVGGRICQSFFVWVLFVAAVAGMEGLKDKSTKSPDVNWSDSEADSETDPQPKLNVLSFKG